jgi:hypothetical protein
MSKPVLEGFGKLFGPIPASIQAYGPRSNADIQMTRDVSISPYA